MKNKYFGTDGIRGTVNQGNITGEKFFKFGLASGTYFKNQKKTKQVAIIAKDTRLVTLWSLHLCQVWFQAVCTFLHWVPYQQMDLPC